MPTSRPTLVSLCPSLTELVFALGRGSHLVGVSDYCIHPAAGVAAVEKVGGTKTPRVARIVELAPDLVLLNEEENRREDALALAAAGLECHASLPRTVAETAEMVRAIGRRVGAEAAAGRIAGEIERRSARVRRAARGRSPVRFAYLIWRKPWMAAGSDTYAHDLLALAGGENVAPVSGDRYPVVTPAGLAAADPALVLLGSEPFPFARAHRDELAAATGLPGERFRLADGELLSWHGARTPAGIDYAEALIAAAAGG